MKSLFEQEGYTEIISRIQQLHSNSPRQWGKMTVSQMMAHCSEAFKVPLSDRPQKRMLLGYLLGGLMKSNLYNEVPWKKNLPTAPNFLIKEDKDFEKEKQQLLAYAEQFYKSGPERAGLFPHPFFGSLTSEQWGKSMYKHLDHHLKQFGV